MREPIETKVIVGAAGAGAGAAVSAFLLWLLGCVFWGQSWDAASATDAVAAVPEPVAGVLALLVTAAGSFAAGYAAPHTIRPTEVRALVDRLEAAKAEHAAQEGT